MRGGTSAMQTAGRRGRAGRVSGAGAVLEVGAVSIDVLVPDHGLGLLMDADAALADVRVKLGPGGRLVVFVPAEMERSLRVLSAEGSSAWFDAWPVHPLTTL